MHCQIRDVWAYGEGVAQSRTLSEQMYVFGLSFVSGLTAQMIRIVPSFNSPVLQDGPRAPQVMSWKPAAGPDAPKRIATAIRVRATLFHDS